MARKMKSTEYDHLCLSLQSPLPNEQDMGISVCALLSNETKHALKLNKAPGVLDLLVAHAGIYNHCGTRELMDETYQLGRGYSFDTFWKDQVPSADIRELLCECFLERYKHSLGITEEMTAPEIEGPILVEEKEPIRLNPKVKFKKVRVETPEESSSVCKENGLLDQDSQEIAESEEKNESLDVSQLETTTDLQEEISESQLDATIDSLNEEDMSVSQLDTTVDSVDKDVSVSELDESIATVGEDMRVSQLDTTFDSMNEDLSASKLDTTTDSQHEDVSVSELNSTINSVSDEISVSQLDTTTDSLKESISIVKMDTTIDSLNPDVSCSHVDSTISTENGNSTASQLDTTVDSLKSDISQLDATLEDDADETGNIFESKSAESDSDSEALFADEDLNEPLDIAFPSVQRKQLWDILEVKPSTELESSFCCVRCPCARKSTVFDSPIEDDKGSLIKLSENADKIGLRVGQIASIIRNLSFDRVNAEVMSHNTAVLRFIVVTANCTFGSLPQLSLDTLGNLAKYMNLENPMNNPYYSMIISLVTDGIFSVDRFRVLRSLETLRDWTSVDSNESALETVLNHRLMERVCHLLTISDIMMLIYSLECILSLTTMNGERMCNELADVPGSVDTLVSLVTVEAQSYGPTGCIHMRVVETVIGHQALLAATQTQAQFATGGNPPQLPGFTAVGQTSVPVGQGSPIAGSTFNPTPLTSAFASPPPTSLTSDKNADCAFAASSFMSGYPAAPIAAAASPPPSSSLSPSPQPIPPSLSPTLPVKGPSATRVNVSTPPRPSSRDSPTPFTNASQAPSSSSYGSLKSYENSPIPVKSEPHSHPPLHTQQAQSLPIAQVQPQVYSPSISLVTPRGTLSEDGWAVAWIKGAFEQVPGTSIEQGEIYRMYCSARKNPNVVLSVEQFIHCVKCTYGAGIGPVIKNFGGGPLFFLEGIRPKMTVCGAIPSNPPPVPIMTGQPGFVSPPRSTTPNPPSDPPSQLTTEAPLSVNIPSRENKTTLSPILKATLSRPPKPKNSVGFKKQKGTSRGSSKCKKFSGGESHKGTSNVLNPTSSAIRSLLASKVAQRQQKKQQLSDTKKSPAKGGNAGKKPSPKTKKAAAKALAKDEVCKVNGIEGTSESSASSSLQSIDSAGSPLPTPLISFQGVLRNGLNESSKDEESLGTDDVKFQVQHSNSKFKGMLVDLLERKVTTREAVNGVVGSRDIRISEKGLEFVEPDTNSNSSSTSATSASFLLNNHTSSSNCVFKSLTGSDTNDSQSSQQQMTFYSATDTQVTFQGQVNNNNGNSKAKVGVAEADKLNCFSDLVLLSGGGNGVNAGGGDSSYSNNSKDMVDINMDDTDLLEKFNEISDLIVVPPEQFGLKRTHSLSEECPSLTSEGEDGKPPFKKPCHSHLPNGNGCVSPSPGQGQESTSFLQTVLNKPAMTTTPATLSNHVTKVEEMESSPTPVSSAALRPQTVNCVPVPSTEGSLTAVATHVPVPLRLAMNTPPAQYTFARLPSGQQILLQGPNSQANLQGAQVLISKPPSSAADQMAKAIIILQPQTPQGPGAPLKLVTNATTVTTTSVTASTTTSNAKTAGSGNSPTKTIPPLSTMTTRNKALSTKQKNLEQLDDEFPYLCEWGTCAQRFNSHQQAVMHVLQTHCPETLEEAIRCDWGGNGCDSVLRKRLSLMTHLQDRHCCKPAFDLALYRRKNKIEPPPPTQTPVNHSGYAPNAAFHAIKRHALQFMNTKELTDDNEGPVTKSIRLTSALILKNLCNYSSLGRKLLRGHESHLASIAMSNVESSRTIAQLLYDMNELSS